MAFNTVNWANPLYGYRVTSNLDGSIVFVGAPVHDSSLSAQWNFFNDFSSTLNETDYLGRTKTGIGMYCPQPTLAEGVANPGVWPSWFPTTLPNRWRWVKGIRPRNNYLSADWVIGGQSRWSIGAGVASTGKEFECDDSGYVLAAVYGDHMAILDANIQHDPHPSGVSLFPARSAVIFRDWGEVFSTAHEVVALQAGVQTTCTMSGDASTAMWCHTTSAGNCSVKVYRRRLFTYYSHSSFARVFDSSNVKLSCSTDGNKVLTCKTGAGGSITISTYAAGWTHVTLASGFTTVRSAVMDGTGLVVAVAGTSATNDSVKVYKLTSGVWQLVTTKTHSPTGTVTTSRHSLCISKDGTKVCSSARVVGNVDLVGVNYLNIYKQASGWGSNEIPRVVDNIQLLTADTATDYGVATAFSRNGDVLFTTESTKEAEIKANPLSAPWVNVYRKSGAADVPAPARSTAASLTVVSGRAGWDWSSSTVSFLRPSAVGEVQWMVVMVDGTAPLTLFRNAQGAIGVLKTVRIGVYTSTTGAVAYDLTATRNDGAIPDNYTYVWPAASWGGGRRTLYIAMSGEGAVFGPDLAAVGGTAIGEFQS